MNNVGEVSTLSKDQDNYSSSEEDKEESSKFYEKSKD